MHTESQPEEAKQTTAAPPGQASTDTTKRRRPVWRSAIWGAVFLLLIGAGYLLSQRTSTSSAKQGDKRGKKGKKGLVGAVPVSIAKVRQGDLGIYITALGTVTPVYTVTLTSRVVGELVAIHYREGQMVHKGDLLAEIDARPYQATLTQAQGQLARDQAVLKNAYIDLDRYKMIYQQRAIPEQQLQTQEATVEQAEGTVKLDQGNLDAAKVNVAYARITAPIDGRVGLRLVDPGNIVQANGTTGLLTITQIQPITIVFTMAEDFLGEVTSQLRAGHRLQVDALDRANQNEIARGSVLTIDNQIDTTTGTVKVRASFTNRDLRLFPNEFVNARLLVKTLKGVNLIPTSAIQRNGDAAFVFVLDQNQTVHTRNISVSATDGMQAAATGVKPDESLVTDGFDRLQDGEKVAIRRESATREETTPQTNQTATEQSQQGNANVQLNTAHPDTQRVNPK
jgi:membrane fusion protein, multidrug efflux system